MVKYGQPFEVVLRQESLMTGLVEHSKVVSLSASSLPRMNLSCLDSSDPAIYCGICAEVIGFPTLQDGELQAMRSMLALCRFCDGGLCCAVWMGVWHSAHHL